MCGLSNQLIQHCSPTLAGMKTAGLFTYFFETGSDLDNSLRLANNTLNPKGIYAIILLMRNDNALIYVYRHSMLSVDLEKSSVKDFLQKQGYTGNSINEYIEILKGRIREERGFPHEIGLFLGYPLGDVLGFIKHGGKNCKFCGYWKVYFKESEALKLFKKYNKCKEVYGELFSQGRPIEQLIVSA